MDNLKQLFRRHIQSPGFQKRLKYIYIPVVQQFLAKPYNWVQNQIHLSRVEEEYKTSPAFESEETMPDSSEQYTGVGVILKEEDAIELFKKYEIFHEDQQFGTCVAHTMKNLYRFAIKACFNGKADFSEFDVYIDRETRGSSIDSGMYPSRTLDRIIGKGIAVRGVIESADEKTDLELTREDYPDELLQDFRVKMLESRSYIKAEQDFEAVWAYIMDTYSSRGVRPFQMSIRSMSGWWGSDVPTPTGRNLGGHSAVGLTIPFKYNGERAFFCIDSSYRRNTTWRVGRGVRIVTESCWRGLGRAVRPVEYLNTIEAKLSGNDIGLPVEPKPVLTVTGALGQSNEHIAKIQKALMTVGFDIPAISSGQAEPGYYGQQTADAVLKFHTHFAPAFTALDPYWTLERLKGLRGHSFGNLSVTVMNEVLSQI